MHHNLLLVLAPLLLCGAVATRVLRHDTVHFGPVAPTPNLLSDFMTSHLRTPILDNDPMSIVMYKLAGAASDFAQSILANLEDDVSGQEQESAAMLRGNAGSETKNVKKSKNVDSDEFPYWRFIPLLAGKVVPDGPQVSWTGLCFAESSAKAETASDNKTVTVTLTLAKAKDLLCSDSFLISDTSQIGLHTYTTHGEKKFSWPLTNLSSSDLWDLNTNGIRLFMFLDPIEEIAKSVTETALLFEPLVTKAVGRSAADRNLDFLSKYAEISMKKRTVTDVVLDASEIHSGDFFGVLRLDGLDPMLAWAMGSTTGHTTVALRDGDDVFVCESTATSSYWDVNGIQCTPYDTWISKAKAASYHVVHLPLAPQYRAAFNETAAWQWFRSVEGLNYGYYNMLYGWVDTTTDNYPCIPPDWTRCLTFDMVEIMFPIGSKIISQFTQMWDQAFNLRLGSRDLGFSQLLQLAASQGVEADTIPVIVEEDSWMYNITRNGKPSSGPSMVCCVFVCHMWKASGMFGDLASQINCGELTNWDDYSMLVFDKDYQRPQACVTADPDNEVCQLLGEYSLHLNNYNSKAPFPHIAEKCPSKGPNYTKPADC